MVYAIRLLFLLGIFCLTESIYPNNMNSAFKGNNQISKRIKPRILIYDPWFLTVACGPIISNFSQSKIFNERGNFLLMLFIENTFNEKLYRNSDLPHEIISLEKINSYYKLDNDKFYKNMLNGICYLPQKILKREIIRVCKKEKINIVITMRWQDLSMLKEIAENLPIKIIFYRHASLEEDSMKENVKTLKGIDGFASVPHVTQFMTVENIMENLDIKNIISTAFFWDEDKFLNFSTQETREEYFKRRFNIRVQPDHHIITTVANFSQSCKNYPLLLQVAYNLIHKKHYQIHFMAAGEGGFKKSMEELAADLDLQEYVHFLGSIDDVPALLYHSDMHVLPSYFESFGKVNLEAYYMKKPVLVAAEIDACTVVRNYETGLLFKNNNVDSLTEKIEYLLNSPEKIISFGRNGYHYAQTEYSNEVLYRQWRRFIDKVLNT